MFPFRHGLENLDRDRCNPETLSPTRGTSAFIPPRPAAHHTRLTEGLTELLLRDQGTSTVNGVERAIRPVAADLAGMAKFILPP